MSYSKLLSHVRYQRNGKCCLVNKRIDEKRVVANGYGGRGGIRFLNPLFHFFPQQKEDSFEIYVRTVLYCTFPQNREEPHVLRFFEPNVHLLIVSFHLVSPCSVACALRLGQVRVTSGTSRHVAHVTT